AALAGERFHPVEEFILAVIATISGVGDIKRIIEFVSLDEDVRNSRVIDEGFDFFAVVRRETRVERGDGERLRGDRLMRGPGEIGGVRAARESDEQGIARAKRIEQALLFF